MRLKGTGEIKGMQLRLQKEWKANVSFRASFIVKMISAGKGSC